MQLDYAYLRAIGYTHETALFKLELERLLADYLTEQRGSNRADVLSGIVAQIYNLHDRVAVYNREKEVVNG